MNIAAFGSLPASACALGTQGSDGPDRISQLVYDAAGQVTQLKVGVGTTDAATERTQTYTNNGLVQTLKDAENNLTTYEYDGFDRLSKTRYPLPTKGSNASSTTDYEQLLNYDANGNVGQRRLRDGTTISFSYDNLDRVTAKDLPGTEPDVTYGYDNLGRLTSASQSGNALSFTYDALSRNIDQTRTAGGFPTTATSAWDAAGRRTQLTYPGTGLFVNYDYLVTGEVTKIRENGATSGVGVLASYAYDALGNRTSLTFGNGVVQNFTFDPVSRLASLSNDLSGTTNDLNITFSYNPASQLKQAVRTGDAYAYTLTSENSTGVANGLNQLTSYAGKSLTYTDGRGNVTAFGSDTLGYSSENLLTSGPNSMSLSYDALLRLYQTSSTTGTSRYAYDGLDMLAQYDGSNALKNRYVFDGAGQPIVSYQGADTSNRKFLSADERGSIISATDNMGALLGINTYDEYGNSVATIAPFGYTGQLWLPTIKLNYYKARMYSPEAGRFLQTDPIGTAGGMNIYGYTGGDPVNLIDPLGLDCTGSRIESSCSGGGVASGLSGTSTTVSPEHWDRYSGERGVGSGVGGQIATTTWTTYGVDASGQLYSYDSYTVQFSGTGGFGAGFGAEAAQAARAAVQPDAASKADIIITGQKQIQLAGFPLEIDLLPPGLLEGLLGGCLVACLEAGTPVATPSGLKPIEQIAVGDLVLSKDEQTGAVAAKRVTRLIRPEPKPVYELALRDASGEVETFHATADHRWFVDGGRWIATAELKTGDRIETGSDADVTVTSVSLTNIVERTYNLEVADWHTFMVGKDHVVVHNGCPPAESPIWKKLRPVRGRSFKTDGKRYYSYDRLHGEIEVFNSRGGHLGVIDPLTGEWIKPAVPGRTLDVR